MLGLRRMTTLDTFPNFDSIFENSIIFSLEDKNV